MAAGAFLTTAALAQAWLPPEGEASLSLGYGNVYSNRHYLGGQLAGVPGPIGDSVQTYRGHIRAQSAGIQLGYGISDRFALSVGIPFITSVFQGVFDNTHGHNFNGEAPDQKYIDDGQYHGTFQDFTVGLRYQLFRGPVALTAFAGAVIPSHSYTYYAHSAAGRDLHEYPIGLSVGALLDRIVPGSYIEASYSYSFVEKVLGIYHDRSDFFVELGYFLTPSLSVRGVGTGTYTHGGLIYKDSHQDVTPELFIHHDQITHSEGILLGGGFSYALTGSTEVYAAYMTQVLGRSGHKINQSLSFGVSWNFSPQQLVRRSLPPKSKAASSEAP
jgi:hypothetical protein